MSVTYILWNEIGLAFNTEMRGELLKGSQDCWGYRLDTKTGDDVIEVGYATSGQAVDACRARARVLGEQDISHVEALVSARSMGQVMTTFERCGNVDHVHEFMAAYAELIERREGVPLMLAKLAARENIVFGLGYCDATDRAKELFARWVKREEGEVEA